MSRPYNQEEEQWKGHTSTISANGKKQMHLSTNKQEVDTTL